MVASRVGWRLLTAVWHLVPFGHLAQLDRPGALLAGTAAAVALLRRGLPAR